jgi:nucleoside-diphosphate-sugar epimerase
MSQVLLTGAHGVIGTALTEHGEWEYVLTDLGDAPDALPDGTPHPHRHRESELVDVTDLDRVTEAVEPCEAIVHLAGSSSTDASFEEVFETNVRGTHNVLEAARQHGVDTVVFASSNHVVGMYEREHAPELYEPEHALVLDSEVAVRPDSEYAASKVAGEAWVRYYAEVYGLRCFVLRIGSVRAPRWDHPLGDAARGVARGCWVEGSQEWVKQAKRLRCTWQSRRDIAQMVECCLAADDVEFGIYYGTSENRHSWLDIAPAREEIGYRPADSADDPRWGALAL